MTVDKMRCKVAEAYGGPTWQYRVKSMDDRQIIAIYKDMCERGVFEKKSKPENKLHKPEKCEQLTIWDLLKENTN